ncbi:unnamed protein product [Mytilus edulis]|uniref:IgGFc-binding protein N-terminal domain-containing protein n=1 Tax=Mytilus edulis TaxID=6550 RepID=A0A8S3RRY3_MYTED|nr:unnamed protein product [Mytilus edulis]
MYFSTFKICDVKPDPTDTGKCYHCCSTDLCNNVGCGEQDHRGLNGSMCYQCDGKLQSEACHQVTFCDYDELCQTVQYPYPVVGKRSVQREKCCNGDLCNNNLNDFLQTSTTIYTTSAESKGTSFLLLFTEGYLLQYATAKALLTTHNGGLYTAYTFGNSMNESWNLKPNQNEFALNHNVYMTDGIKHAGVELQGNKQISVFGFSYNNYSNDGYSGGYLAIPTNFLSRRYIIPSFNVYNQGSLSRSMIALTPLESSTTVNIHLKTTSGYLSFKSRQYSSGENITAVISKYDTLEISHTFDLTGTFISSSNPLAVVSGNKCNYINHKNGCNTFIEMVLPVEQLDTIYIVPHIATRVTSTLRLLSLNASSVTIKIQIITQW